MEESHCRKRVFFDFEWLFLKQDPVDAEKFDFDDTTWRRLNLPHDFSIEGPWAEDNASSYEGGYAPLGLGWYRKHFHLPQEWSGMQIYAEFDGVFNHSEVWVNGQKVGHNEYGYIGFECDLTSWVKFGQDNVLAVRVDNLKQASRWYTGSGIYRHVWLTATDPLHIAHWGTYITTPTISDNQAEVKVQTTLQNDTDDVKHIQLVTQLVDPDGNAVGSAESSIEIKVRGETFVTHVIKIIRPQLWSLESPGLYRAISTVREGDRVADLYETPFGVRTIEFNPDNGFMLNGKRVVIKGVNLHHDLGALGAASFDNAIERRLKAIQEIGCNAVRLSHNPHSPELLHLCDRMGILVFDEAFDKWYGFRTDGTGWKDDLRAFIQRDRNHPSVFIWSTGNEILPHQNNHEGARLYKSMSDFIHEFEPTRPVTAALDHHRTSGKEDNYVPLAEIAQYMDVITMNYQTQNYARDHVQHPDQVFLGGEVYIHQFHNLNLHGRAVDSSASAWFATRDSVTNAYSPYVAGQFIWAGIDYLGESRRWLWPQKGNDKNLINTCGWRKPISYFIQSLYSDEPLVRIAVDPPDFERNFRKYCGRNWNGLNSHWTWPAEIKTLRVYTFTNADQVELILNGKSLGEKRLADFGEHIIHWDVPNEPGTLEAVARINGTVVATHNLKTSGLAARLQLISDRDQLEASGQDLAYVEARMVDESGNIVPHMQTGILFRISGPGFIAGVDNGDLDSQEEFKAWKRQLRGGHCLAIVQSTREPGVIRLRAGWGGMEEESIEIEVK